MTDGDQLDGQLTAEERSLTERLDAQRPVPVASFRGALKRRLATLDPGYRPRPARLRLFVSAYLVAGSLLVGSGALHATGVF